MIGQSNNMKTKLESKVSNEGHRDHWLRNVQRGFERLVPGILFALTSAGLLSNTKVEQAIEKGKDIHPDDVTLAGLQLTIEAANELFSSDRKILSFGKLLLGTILDAADGALARHQGQVSPEGAIKDVAADRIVENYLAKLIAENINRYSDEESNLRDELITAFQLSTLIKATCEMFGAQTSEGGQGGMMQRRKRLFSIMRKMVRLNKLTLESGGKDEVSSNEVDLLTEIKAEIKDLIAESFESAKGRVGSLVATSSISDANYDIELQDSDSRAAVEARKYVAITFMIQDKFGLDMLPVLNNLNEDFSFPAPEELQLRYSYIQSSVKQVQEFVEEAMLFFN